MRKNQISKSMGRKAPPAPLSDVHVGDLRWHGPRSFEPGQPIDPRSLFNGRASSDGAAVLGMVKWPLAPGYYQVHASRVCWRLTGFQLGIKCSFSCGRLDSSAMQATKYKNKEPIGNWEYFSTLATLSVSTWPQRVGQAFPWAFLGGAKCGLRITGQLDWPYNPYRFGVFFQSCHL